MEGEVGAHVAAPIFLQKPVLKASNLAKKHDFPWQTSTVHPNPNSSWNPRQFSWDSVAFSVRPSSDEVGNSKGAIFHKNYEEGSEDLALKLGGGGAVVPEEDPAAGRPSKKILSGSPGGSGGGGGGRSYLMCQVDDCLVDLSNAKDNHRRHKVCEIHNKMTKALVGTQMQRFCQQCSRFGARKWPKLDLGQLHVFGWRICRHNLL